MGFLNQMKGSNNYWGYVTYLSNGSLNRLYGHIGPKNMLLNGSQELMITGASNVEIIFSMDDVESAATMQATAEWVKYRICLKNGLSAVVIIPVTEQTAQKHAGNSSVAGSGSGFSNNWLNFEGWLGEALSRGDIAKNSAQQINTSNVSATNDIAIESMQKRKTNTAAPRNAEVSKEAEGKIDEKKSVPSTKASELVENSAEEKEADFATDQEMKLPFTKTSLDEHDRTREKTEKEHLQYALRYETDEGMIGYLKMVQSEFIQGIVKDIQKESHRAREIVKQAVENQ